MKKIPNFPNYAVTKEGIVWSERRRLWLKPSCGERNRYFHVNLTRNCITYTRYIHRLVLETYIGSCPNGMECRHLDGDYSNNSLVNLCWGTHKENASDMVKHGTAFFSRRERKRGLPAKLSEEQVKTIRKMLKIGIVSQVEIAKFYNVSSQLISAIKKQRIWKKCKIEVD